MWMGYDPILKGRLEATINFENPLRRFSEGQKGQSWLALSSHHFIPTSRIFRWVIPNGECYFWQNPHFYLIM